MSNSKIYLGSTNLGTGKIRLGANDVSAIYLGESLLYPPTIPQPTPPSLSDCVCFEALDANTSIRLHASQDYSFFPVNLWYSTDGGTTFSKMDRLTPITLPNIGDKMYVYGSNVSLGQSNLNYVRFLIYDGDVSVSGDLTRLLNPNGLTTLPDYAFVKTFSNNTHLADVSGLTIPVTTVGKSSLAGLFDGCSNITTAPTLPATTLGEGCYEEMFYGCSNLNYIKVGATTWNTSWAGNWVQNVAATGTFVKPVDLTIGTGTGEIPSDSVNGIPIGWTVQNTNDYLCFTAVAPNAKISLNPAPSDYSDNLYYSTDGGTTFNTLEPHTNITLANIGDKMYVYGNNASLGQSVHFQISADTSISGNLTTLLNPDGLTTLPDYAFVGTFKNNTHIVDVSGLTIPVTSVGQNALQSLFSGCTNITTAPALPATTIGNGCYSYMFYGCTSLTSAPALPATTLATQCYYGMFQGCTSLITPPSLPATTLATYCYAHMFLGCTSLTTSPDLNALTLLHSSYDAMFYGCTNLNSIKCLATNISAQACTDGWVDGVSATGTFTKNPQMSNWTTGIDGIPSGWTVVDAQ